MLSSIRTAAIVQRNPGFPFGMGTFSMLQRSSPVNIERNKKKNPRYPPNHKSRYEIIPKHPRITIREVNFILKVKPIIRPITQRRRRLFFLSPLSFQACRRSMSPLIANARYAGSSFISFAC